MENQLFFKVLVNKQSGLFGVFHHEEIWDSSSPTLLGESVTMEDLKKYAAQGSRNQILSLKDPNELERYDLRLAELVVR